MLILTIRTDKPDAEIGLYDDDKQLAYQTWLAHRQLAETLHSKLQDLLTANNKTLADLEAIVVFQGPGSFTGLRIGLTVANALAYSLRIPIIAKQDPHWIEAGLKDLAQGKFDAVAMPEYGALPHITPQRK